MVKPVLTVLFLMLAFFTDGQVISVFEQNTNKTLNGVFITNTNETTSTISNYEGIADLSVFSQKDTLIFSHTGFEPLLKSIIDITNKVYLKKLTLEMSEVTVSANKWEQSLELVPKKVIKISSKEIQYNNPQTAADLLSTTGEVFVQKSQMGGGSPMIRGFSANSVLIMVDGVRLNNAIFRSGNLHNIISLDPGTIAFSEVILGPGSVLYGSDALGGVIDFHTIDPTFTDSVNISGSLSSRYSSANNEKLGSINLALSTRRISTYHSVSFSDFGNLTSGNNRPEEFPDFGKRNWYVIRRDNRDIIEPNLNENRQLFSAYSQFNTLHKFRIRTGNSSTLGYAFYYSETSNIPRYDRLIVMRDNLPRSSEWYYGPQKWMRNQLTFNTSSKTLFYDELRSNLAWQNFKESRHSRIFNMPLRTDRKENVNLYTFNIDAHKNLGNKSSLFYGYEQNLNDVNSNAKAVNIETNEFFSSLPRYPEQSKYQTFAGYIAWRKQLWREHFLSTGLRYNYINSESRMDRDRFPPEYSNLNFKANSLNGNISYIINTPNWRFTGLVSTGFRAPNIDDIAKVFDSEPGNVIIPNPGLGPETTYNSEFTVERKLGGKGRLSATGFITRLENVIVRRNSNLNGEDSIYYDGILSRVQTQVNGGKGFIQGLNLTARYRFNQSFSLTGNLTIMNGEDQDGYPLRHVTPTFGDLRLIYEKNSFRTDLLYRFSGGLSFEELSPSEQSKPHLYTRIGSSYSWGIVVIRAQYSLSDKLTITSGIENLLDIHYRPYSSGISAPGRNIYASLTFKF